MRLDLNVSNVSKERICVGNAFHKAGAAEENDRSPYIDTFLFVTSKFFPEERRLRLGTYSVRRLNIYAGAQPCIALQVISRILYSVRSFTGSQCSPFKTGEI